MPRHLSARFFSEEHEVTGLKHNQGWLKVNGYEAAILPLPLFYPKGSFSCEVGSWTEGKGVSVGSEEGAEPADMKGAPGSI